jgi:hypothetical protein
MVSLFVLTLVLALLIFLCIPESVFRGSTEARRVGKAIPGPARRH